MSAAEWQPGDISTPARAIMTFCWECLGGETPVEECAAIDCPLYAHRLGKAARAAIRESERVRRLSGRVALPEKVKKAAGGGMFTEPEEPETAGQNPEEETGGQGGLFD